MGNEKIQENKTKSTLQAIFDLEDWLREQEKPIETQASMYWGALWVAHNTGKITWDETRNMFGEFVSKRMGLR